MDGNPRYVKERHELENLWLSALVQGAEVDGKRLTPDDAKRDLEAFDAAHQTDSGLV